MTRFALFLTLAGCATTVPTDMPSCILICTTHNSLVRDNATQGGSISTNSASTKSAGGTNP